MFRQFWITIGFWYKIMSVAALKDLIEQLDTSVANDANKAADDKAIKRRR